MYKTIYQKQKRAKVWLITPKLQGRTARASSVGCAGPELSGTMNEPSTKYHLRWFGRECICNYLFLAKLESHADEYLIAQDKEFIFSSRRLEFLHGWWLHGEKKGTPAESFDSAGVRRVAVTYSPTFAVPSAL